MTEYHRFRDQLAEALDPRLHRIEHLDALIGSGEAQCWATDKAAIVAGIQTFPTGARAVSGLVAAGELNAIVALIPLAEEWGKQHGCTLGMIDSTPGWARVMKPHGYAVHQVSLIKDLR